MRLTLLAILGALGPLAAVAAPPFVVADRIPLGEVSGRLDHLAADLAGERLFVAELGNDSVAVVDLASRRVAQRLSPLGEPQGVAYSAAIDTLAVSSARDGTVRFFHGRPLVAGAVVERLPDADNLRLEPATGRLVVGQGEGALTVLEWPRGERREAFALPGHPESFQLESRGPRVFVNVPDVAAVVVLRRDSPQPIARWALPGLRGNYAMALDETQRWLWTVSRQPARITVLDTTSGAIVTQVPSCADADDVFIDARRKLTYVVCGEGQVQVVAWGDGPIRETARFPIAPGARTGLFVPEWDALFVAAPARGDRPATIWRLAPSSPATPIG